MWQISKDFDFCYGHRIHSQNLEKSLSCGAEPKCLRLHGHNGTIKVKSIEFGKGDILIENFPLKITILV